MKYFFIATLFLMSTVMVASVQAMVIRHDVDPILYLTEETQYPTVFPVADDGTLKECVATLIDQQWALTAAHCTVLIDGQDLENHPHPVRIAHVSNHVIDVVMPEQYGEHQLILDEDGNLVGVNFDDVDFRFDMALLKLKSPVTHVSPIPLYRESDEVGKEVLLLGWGDFGTGDQGVSEEKPINDGKFRQARNQITGVDGNLLTFRFDAPGSEGVLDLEGVNGPGDSGGPALVKTPQGFALIGISSAGEYDSLSDLFSNKSQYDWNEYYIRTSKMMEWIDSIRKLDSH